MTETRQTLNEKRAVTPLWIVALFVSLTETVLGIAVTQTSGNIQAALTVFVLAFPVVIAGAFFGILWHKPYVFYPPTEFGTQTNVVDYVTAMQRKPELFKQNTGKQEDKLLNTAEKKATDEVADKFIEWTSPAGLLIIYFCSIAQIKKLSFNLREFCSTLEFATYDYTLGFLIAIQSADLISVNELKGIWSITDINKKLQKATRSEFNEISAKLLKRLEIDDEASKTGIQDEADRIEKYFQK